MARVGVPEFGKSLKRRLDGIFYGYWILLAGSLILIFSYGFMYYGFTIYFLPLSRELGVSRTAISLLYGLSRLEGGAEGPFIGRLIDRFGPRFVIIAGAGLTGLGFVILSQAQSFWAVLLTFALAISLGYNAGFYHPISTAINSWFIKRRGMGFAVLDSVGSLGAVVIVPVLSYWVLNMGWREAATLAGVITLALVPPLAMLIHRSPESVGLQPDGSPQANTGGARPAAAMPEFSVGAAVRTTSFWILTLTITLRLSVTTAVAAHMVPILVWRGMDEATAAFGVSLFALGCIITPLLLGWLGDRWSKTRLSAVSIVVAASGIILMLTGTSPLLLYLFPLTMAVALGTAPLNWSLVGDYFGRGSYATLRGVMRVVNGCGAFIFPVYAGWVFDRTGSYTLVLVPFAIVFLISALFFWRVRPPKAAPATAAA